MSAVVRLRTRDRTRDRPGNQDRSRDGDGSEEKRGLQTDPTGSKIHPNRRRPGERGTDVRLSKQVRPRPTRTPRHLNPTSLSPLEPRTHCRHLGKEREPPTAPQQTEGRQENHFLFSADKEAEAGQRLT